MRHETCLTCTTPAAGDRHVQTMILVAEALGDLTHHHHTVKCDGCGGWWFDDVTLSDLGTPNAHRRDAELCGCPDGLPQYTVAAVIVPRPEADCACTKAETERFALPIRMRSAG